MSFSDHAAVITAHTISLGAIVGSFAGIIPPLAALGALVWYVIQIFESSSVQKFAAFIKEKLHGTKPATAPSAEQSPSESGPPKV